MPAMKNGDKFNAYTKQFGNLMLGAPFVCTGIDEKNYKIYATDKHGNPRKFFTIVRYHPDWAEQDWGVLFRIFPKGVSPASA